MKAEIIARLNELLKAEDIFKAQKEFKQLSSQYKSLLAHQALEETGNESDDDDSDDDEEQESVGVKSDAQTAIKAETTSAKAEKQVADPVVSEVSIEKETLAVSDDKSGEISEAAPEPEISENLIEAKASDEETDNPISAEETSSSDASSTEQEPAISEDEPKELAEAEAETGTDSAAAGAEDQVQLDESFTQILATWKTKIEKAKVEKQRIEEETIATAKDLTEELRLLIINEENIGKAFLGFNAIKDKWRELPKVSNDSYRDLNADYNKQVELFFYNINIYKELKELDLKHNFEEKTRVLADQKKLVDENDVRLLEVEVRLNQDRWNEIGPTHQEHWDALKDEFWGVTREIYRKIQAFYNQRREDQDKHVERRNVLLEKAKLIANLELRNPKKWQEKTNEMLEIQKEWNLVGFISKDISAPMWKEYRAVCNTFFNNKRAFHDEIKKVQDANRKAKQELVDKAEALKEDQNWKDSTLIFTGLQKSWREIGPAHQREENKLWTKFREACDHFFQARKSNQGAANAEQQAHLNQKLKLIEQVNAIETTDRKEMIDALKEAGESWRKIGHVPYKDKDKVNDAYRAAVDAKYDSLDMDKRSKEKMRFEQRVDDFKDGDNSDRFLRKEQDILLGKISKIQSEITLLENNMGFFAASKGADKFKVEIQRKIDKGRDEIAELQDRMNVLKKA